MPSLHRQWRPDLHRQWRPDKWHRRSLRSVKTALQSLRLLRSLRSLKSLKSLRLLMSLWSLSSLRPLFWPRWDFSSWPGCRPTLAQSLTWVWRYRVWSYLFGAFRYNNHFKQIYIGQLSILLLISFNRPTMNIIAALKGKFRDADNEVSNKDSLSNKKTKCKIVKSWTV